MLSSLLDLVVVGLCELLGIVQLLKNMSPFSSTYLEVDLLNLSDFLQG
mgnify:CR=1 FL=1